MALVCACQARNGLPDTALVWYAGLDGWTMVAELPSDALQRLEEEAQAAIEAELAEYSAALRGSPRAET